MLHCSKIATDRGRVGSSIAKSAWRKRGLAPLRPHLLRIMLRGRRNMECSKSFETFAFDGAAIYTPARSL
jgi:hypothetical protein